MLKGLTAHLTIGSMNQIRNPLPFANKIEARAGNRHCPSSLKAVPIGSDGFEVCSRAGSWTVAVGRCQLRTGLCWFGWSFTLVLFAMTTSVHTIRPQRLGVVHLRSPGYRVHGTVQLAGALALSPPLSRSGRLGSIATESNLAADAAAPMGDRCDTPPLGLSSHGGCGRSRATRQNGAQ